MRDMDFLHSPGGYLSFYSFIKKQTRSAAGLKALVKVSSPIA
jgi:hypothetical protein